MSETPPNPDLEKFRQQWKKELDQKSKDQPSTSQSEVPKSALKGTDPYTFRVDHFSEFSLPPVNAELAKIPLQDDNSCDGFEINAYQPQTGGTGSDSNSEYYPFKILTQFLNEAPKRMESRQTKKVLRSAAETVSKRKYFHEVSQQSSKKLKEETICAEEDMQGKKKEPEEEKQMLDIFLADLDEINEIPFFDTSVPREVAIKIFHHLDMKSLCSCSQVSKSWRSLADDELLWFQIYQQKNLARAGTETHVSEDVNWKGKVRRVFEEKRLLDANWKARTGKPYHLNFAQGGVLCAVHSHGATIVAGYSGCNVRSWDTRTGDICTYNATNTALVLDDNIEDDVLCRVNNTVKHLQTTGKFTAASFAHGFVDVWSSEAGTEAVHTLSFNNRGITSLAMGDLARGRAGASQSSVVVAAAQGTRVQVSHVTEGCGQVAEDFDVTSKVTQLDFLGDSQTHHSQSANLLVTCDNTVCIRRVDLKETLVPHRRKDPVQMTEVHNIFWAPITAVSLRAASTDLAVGFNVYAGAAAQIKVNVYDLSTLKLMTTLTGHTWVISTIHLPEALPGQLVTGSGDRKIRLYDLRAASFPMLTLAGHSARVTSAEMDEWKVVSADEAGFVCVWDQRMARKLWDVHNRHPVEYCHCEERLLIVGNIPREKFPVSDEFDKVSALRYRGTIQVYDFLANQQRQDIPNICLSAYDEPEAYDYNIRLAMPYDHVS